MRIALIVIAALALPGTVRRTVGSLDAAAPRPAARWRVVGPQRIVRAEMARLRVRQRVRQVMAAEARATLAR